MDESLESQSLLLSWGKPTAGEDAKPVDRAFPTVVPRLHDEWTLVIFDAYGVMSWCRWVPERATGNLVEIDGFGHRLHNRLSLGQL